MNDLFLGLDLGGTGLKAAIGDDEGNLVGQRSIPTESYLGPDHVIDQMAKLVDELAAEAGARPRAIGVGCPGLVDRSTGSTLFLPNLSTHWRDIPLAARLMERTKAPTYLLNDARMATLGELAFGHGKEPENPTLVVLTLGTGIGGGVVVDGRLVLGPMGAAGELGHLVIEREGRRCGCGARGCVEAYASAPAMIGEGVRLLLSGQAPKLFDAVEGKPSGVTPQTMAAAADQGDEAVAAAIGVSAQAIGLAVANVVVTLHPQLVVLTGGVAQMGERLLGTVRATLYERVRVFPPDRVAIEVSRLGEQAGVLGGIAWAARGGAL